ncbi:hypothetical protein MNBD_NITROSPINAE03-2091 [hydrothermal vent metagenome]|uniref:Fibronectin type-III domain-containing protein n=1 Tax=hydrothermal vent metagenome TaxID=652676 RepID=A0A3B1BWN2_9ZZZZ
MIDGLYAHYMKKIGLNSTRYLLEVPIIRDFLNYKVKAYNYENELSDFSETGFVIAKGGPDLPTRLTVISGSIMQTPLVWEASADKETVGYTISRSESKAGEYKQIARITSSDTREYIDKLDKKTGHDLEDGKTYWYRIVSYNKEDKQGNMTEPVSGSSRHKPKPPSNFRVVSSAMRSISLAWDRHPDSEIKKYRIYRNSAADGDYKLVKEISDRSETEYTDKDKSGEKIHDGQKYYYRMAAVNSGGSESELTAPVSGSEVIGHAIYRGESPDSLKLIKKIRKRSANKFKDAGSWDKRLKDGTKYYYTVRSINTVGVESMIEEVAEAFTKPVPVAPAGMSATQNKVGKTTLSWSPNTEPDIVSYRILRSGSVGGKFRAIGSVGKATFEDVGLKNGALYYYQTQAIDKDGLVSEPSETVEATTKPTPSAPLGLEASAAKSSSYIVEKLKSGSTYSYIIVAVDKDKLSSEPSVPAQVKTIK